MFANRALLHRFIESVPAAAKKPVILMGNSMGGMICVLEASAAPETVAALILVDSALPFVLTRPDPLDRHDVRPVRHARPRRADAQPAP